MWHGPLRKRRWQLACFLSLLGFIPSLLVGAFVDTSALLFWLVIGLGLRFGGKKRIKRLPNQIALVLGKTALVALLVISAFFSLLRYTSRYYYDLGSQYKAVNELEKAETALRKAAFLLPGNYYYPLELARINFLQNDIPSAMTHYQEVLSILPFDVSMYGEYGNQLYATGQKELGRSVLKRALALAPVDAGGDLAPNLIFDDSVPLGEKKKYFENLLKGNIGSFYKLMEADSSKQAQAIYLFTQGDVTLLGDVQRYHFLRLGGLLENSHANSVSSKIDEVTQGNSGFVWKSVARYRARGNLNESNRLINEHMRGFSRDSVFLNEMGINLFVARRFDEAEITFKAAIRNWGNLYVENLIAHEYLEQIYKRSHRQSLADKHRRAAEFIKRHLSTKVALSLGSWFDPEALQIKEYMNWL
jgi:tetratricopeptide (TPR) repeat protein